MAYICLNVRHTCRILT